MEAPKVSCPSCFGITRRVRGAFGRQLRTCDCGFAGIGVWEFKWEPGQLKTAPIDEEKLYLNYVELLQGKAVPFAEWQTRRRPPKGARR